MFDNKNSTSFSAAAKRFSCARSTNSKTLKDNFNITAMKRKTVLKFDSASEKINKPSVVALSLSFPGKVSSKMMISIFALIIISKSGISLQMQQKPL